MAWNERAGMVCELDERNAVEEIGGQHSTEADSKCSALSEIEAPCVLVVEHVPEVLDTAAALLKRNGIASTGVRTLRDALLVLACWSIEVVILDLLVPEAPDVEIFRAIRCNYPDMPIIVSCTGGIEDIQPEILCDPNAYLLAKPYDGRQLCRAVGTLACVETT